MRYSYLHEAAENYLIITGENIISDNDYRIMMLRENKLNRFLELKVNYVDNEAKYYYKISSRQSLKSMFDSQKLKYGEILTIVSGIKEAVNELERYLLDLDSIILNPDNIYVNPSTKEPEFCYNPECDVGILEGIRELFRYFLNIIDNSDKKTVEYAYGIYCRAMRDDFSLDDISDDMESYGADYGDCYFQAAESDVHREDMSIKVPYQNQNRYETGGIWGFICRIFKINDKKTEKKCEGMSYGNEVSEIYEEEEKTELLDTDRYNYSLMPTDGQGVIEISEFPFVVGKLPDQVNYVIYSDKVSRLHAKILMDENKIYIMDINSKNGTYINGMRISLYEKIELKPGDKVRFADKEYIYQQVH